MQFVLCDLVGVEFPNATLGNVEWDYSACPSGDLPDEGVVQTCCNELVGPPPLLCTSP